jgi:glycosyltransferase involved in cell wall biosynthesis
MRVGFDARWYNESGVGTYVKELLTAFSEFKDEVEIIAYEDPKNPLPASIAAVIRRVPLSSSKFTLGEQFELRARCKSDRIDIFHSPYQYGAPLLLTCPLVVTVHDLIPFLFRTRSWPKQLAVIPFVKLGYRAAATSAHHIIADSQNTAHDVERILRVPPDRITPIHLAASEVPFHPCPVEEEAADLSARYGVKSPYVVVGSAGNWRTKNLETSLRALALGREISGIDFQTVVYGPEKGLNVLVKRSPTLGSNLRRVGYLPVNDLGALFRNAMLFITASQYEGFGLPIVEAMSCGCPVVTSNGGSLGEVAGDGAQVFDPMDARGMAEAVARLLCKPEEHQHWRARGLARATNFSWRKAAEQTLAVYHKLCDLVRDREHLVSSSTTAAPTVRDQDAA